MGLYLKKHRVKLRECICLCDCVSTRRGPIEKPILSLSLSSLYQISSISGLAGLAGLAC